MVAGHHGYLVQCPNSDSSCPTCGQFKQLEDTVSQLQQYIKELNSRVRLNGAPFIRMKLVLRPVYVSSLKQKKRSQNWKVVNVPSPAFYRIKESLGTMTSGLMAVIIVHVL